MYLLVRSKVYCMVIVLATYSTKRKTKSFFQMQTQHGHDYCFYVTQEFIKLAFHRLIFAEQVYRFYQT